MIEKSDHVDSEESKTPFGLKTQEILNEINLSHDHEKFDPKEIDPLISISTYDQYMIGKEADSKCYKFVNDFIDQQDKNTKSAVILSGLMILLGFVVRGYFIASLILFILITLAAF